MMRELPILFSTAMVEANLAGRKTQTRRTTGLNTFNESPDDWKFQSLAFHEKLGLQAFFVPTDQERGWYGAKFPYGNIWDLLWVREAFNYWDCKMVPYVYKATDLKSCGHTWRPSIHMPKAAARIWLEVTDVRAERLSQISEADAIAEGIEQLDMSDNIKPLYKNYLKEGSGFYSAQQSFKSLFLSINGKVTAVKDKSGTITHYEAIAWDDQDYKDRFEFSGNSWRNKPLKVTVDPWVWVIEYKNLSTSGKPSIV